MELEANNRWAVRAHLERALELDEAHVDVLTTLGALLVASGDCAAGRETLERALVLDPGSAAGWFHLGNALRLRQCRDFDEAESAYREALRLQPALAAGWLNLGTLYLEDGAAGDGHIERVRAAHDAFDRVEAVAGELSAEHMVHRYRAELERLMVAMEE